MPGADLIICGRDPVFTKKILEKLRGKSIEIFRHGFEGSLRGEILALDSTTALFGLTGPGRSVSRKMRASTHASRYISYRDIRAVRSLG